MGALRIFSMIVGILTNIIVVRTLGPADFGIYSLILYTAGAIGVFANIGLDQALPRYVAELKVKGNYGIIHSLVNKSLKYRLAILIILSSLLFVLSEPLADFLNNPAMAVYLKITGFILIPSILLTILNSAYSGLQDFSYVTKFGILLSFLNLAFIVIAIKFGLRITGILVALFLSNLIILLIYFYNFSKILPKDTQTKDASFGDRIKRFAAFSTAIGIIDYIVWNRSGTFFLGIYRTPEEVGYFSVAYNLAFMVLLTIPSLISVTTYPAISKSITMEGISEKVRRYYTLGIKYNALISIPIFVFSVLYMREILSILYTEKFLPAFEASLVIFIIAFLGTLTQPSSIIYYAMERNDIILKIGVIGVIITLFSNIILVPLYGLLGASIAYFFSQIWGIVAGNMKLRNMISVNIPIKPLLKLFSIGLLLGLPFKLFLPAHDLTIILYFIIYSLVFYFVIVRYKIALDDSDIEKIKEITSCLIFKRRLYSALKLV